MTLSDLLETKTLADLDETWDKRREDREGRKSQK